MTFYEQDKATAVIKLYGRITEWYNNGEDFSNAFERLDSAYKNIIIRMHCYGGSVIEGTIIYNAIRNARAQVTVMIDGLSASMGTIIMLAADKVIAADNAMTMVHAPSSYVEGNAAKLKSALKALQVMEANFRKRYAEKTGKAEKDVAYLLDGQDHWMSAQEAKDLGLIDEVAPAVVKNIKALDTPTEALTEDVAYARYTALLENLPTATADSTPNPKPQTVPQPELSMKKLLISMFALAGVTEASTDEEVAAAMKTQMDGLKAQMATQAKAQVSSIIATAEQAAGRTYGDDYKAHLQKIGEMAGVETLQAMLGVAAAQPAAAVAPAAAPAPAVPQIVNLMGNATAGTGGAADRASWNWEKWMKEDSKGLEAMAAKDYTAFNALYKAEFGTEAPK